MPHAGRIPPKLNENYFKKQSVVANPRVDPVTCEIIVTRHDGTSERKHWPHATFQW